MDNQKEESIIDKKREQDKRNVQANYNNAVNFFEVAGAIKHPVFQAISKIGKTAHNVSGGKSTEALAKDLNRANKITPGGRTAQRSLNKSSESGLSDAAGKAASIKNIKNGSNYPNATDGNTKPSDGISKGTQAGENKGSSASANSKDAKNNSGFGNNKSGIFSNSAKPSNDAADSSKSSKGGIYKIFIVIAIVLIGLPLTIVIFLMVMQMSPLLAVSQFMGDFLTGVEKFINFAEGDGWLTDEEYFFEHLKQEREKFSKTVSEGELDIPLIAATIHYSKIVDLDQLGEEEAIDDENYTDDSFGVLGQVLDKAQTASFYNIAQDKLGSVNTLWPGQKRLLGHVVKTEIKMDFLKPEYAEVEWKEFYELVNQSIEDTTADASDTIPLPEIDPVKSIFTFIEAYNAIAKYVYENGDALAGLKYNERNLLYEAQEFLDTFKDAFESLNGAETNETGEYTKEQEGWVFTPVVTRKANYGYDEYNQMQQDMLGMKSILRKNGMSYESDSDILKQAENTSNTQLKELFDSYKTNESKYEYSYTHYLQTVYIPFTYFYGQEYTQRDVDSIVEEIYDQRDFYNYLFEDSNDDSCNGGCTYSVAGKEVSNLKVRLLQCSNGDLGEPIPGEEVIDFEKYILGVVYAEIGDEAPVEAAKAQAIAARSYALTRAKVMGNAYGLKLEKESGNWILSIRNCTEDQVYCDPDKGCSNTTKPSESGNSTTVYSGTTTKPYTYKGPLPEDAQIRTAVSSVSGKVLLDENGQIVAAGYTDKEHQRWKKQANTGMDYTEMLLDTYENGHTISQSNCSNVCNQATGDYTQWKQLASLGAPWANVVIGNGKTIDDIGCLVTSVAIQIARSGVPLQNINGQFNPGVFVESIKPNGFVDANWNVGGTRFVYASPTKIAPTFVYQKSESLTGLTQAQKAQKVQNLINEGCYLVMEVKGNGGGQHWVAVDYVQGDTVYMMDPASTQVNTWQKYPHSWTTEALCYKVSG